VASDGVPVERQHIKSGVQIIFRKLPHLTETITVEVLGLYPFDTFAELYNNFDFSEFGCAGYTMAEMLAGTRRIYTEEQEKRHGALGIRVRLLNR
jgi:ASC-1-like (ASCH) protein